MGTQVEQNGKIATAEFKDAINGLNEAQREAVTSPASVLQVLAPRTLRDLYNSNSSSGIGED
jgi:hypothetical protein